jgi:predicted lipoprotein
MRACLIPLLMVVLAAAAPARAQSPLEQLNQALVDGVIIPGYEGFAAAARETFADAMLAWQRVQPVVFGPIVAGARASVIQLFPDRRGVISRQLSRRSRPRIPRSSRPASSKARAWR